MIIETERLWLRRPRAADARSIFDRYATDPEVCRYLAWPAHRSLDDTMDFIAFSDGEWQHWPAGPFLVFSKQDGSLLGSSGLRFEAPHRATIGYAFARDAWGNGYATEAALAMVDLARRLGVAELGSSAHVDHAASQRVLEKAGFAFDGIERAAMVFPNIDPDNPLDLARYRYSEPG